MAISIEWSSHKLGISPFPTSSQARKKALKALPPESLIHGDIYELGAGWGGTSLALAKKYPHRNVVGFEKSILPYLTSKIRCLIARRPNLSIRYKNFMDADFKKCGLVLCYLSPSHMIDIEDTVIQKLHDDQHKSYIASNTFQLPNTPLLKKHALSGLMQDFLYVYEV